MSDLAAPSPNPPTHAKPSGLWYALAGAMLVVSLGVFAAVLMNKSHAVRRAIEAMPRFVGPTGEGGVLVKIDTTGRHYIYYENLGTHGGQTFDTPRNQVWTHPRQASMRCTVTRAQSGEDLGARLPEVGGDHDKREVNEDLIYPYRYPDRQGLGVWVFEVDSPGEHRITINYVDAVTSAGDRPEVRPELTRQVQRGMTSEQGAEYEAARQEELAGRMLAEVRPVDVLFAVGPDPSNGGYFQVLGVKGAATLLAFGFTFSVLITLVTYMLRNGHVTPRGELGAIRRA